MWLVPTSEVVTHLDDLEYVNRKFSRSGVRGATVRAAEYGEGSSVSNSTSSGRRQSSHALESSARTLRLITGQRRASEPTTPSTSIKSIPKKGLKHLEFSSSDSKARCTSEDSLLQGIEHKAGRYFGNGEDASIDKQSFISQFLTYRVPAPNIDEPWMRMNRASQDDWNQVWQCQENHMWSPIICERSSPLAPPRRACPVRAGSASNNEPPRLGVSSAIHDQPTRSRPLCSADFEDSDDEDDISCIDIWNDAGAVPPVEDILQCPEAEMKKIQLLLQAKILREIAELVHQPGANHRLWGDGVA